MNYSIRPNLSIQYYGQPFVSKGNYTEFKEITDSRNERYQNRFHTFTENEISYNGPNDQYQIDENGDGVTDYSFSNPNFDFMQYRSNLVVRWEYKPGSTLFLVWNKELTDNPQNDEFSLSESIRNFLKPENQAHNIFLLKFTYRFVL